MRLRPLLALDFDGTQSPIVTRPDNARVSAALARRLERLSRRLPVAVVTGRRVDDVATRLRFHPGFIVGNHGAEDPSIPASPEMGAILDPLRERLRARAQRARLRAGQG